MLGCFTIATWATDELKAATDGEPPTCAAVGGAGGGANDARSLLPALLFFFRPNGLCGCSSIGGRPADDAGADESTRSTDACLFLNMAANAEVSLLLTEDSFLFLSSM